MIFWCKSFSKAISLIFNCFLVRNYSAIQRNEMTQAEAIIARNRISIWNPKLNALYLINMITIPEMKPRVPTVDIDKCTSIVPFSRVTTTHSCKKVHSSMACFNFSFLLMIMFWSHRPKEEAWTFNRLLRALQKFCTDLDMKLAVEKTVIIAYGTNQKYWSGMF